MKTYWISFGAEKNLGCCIVDAENPVDAIKVTKTLGINPGGEPMVIDLTNLSNVEDEVNQWGKNKLITREELVAAGYTSTDELSDEVNEKIEKDPRITKICNDCNHDYINLI